MGSGAHVGLVQVYTGDGKGKTTAALGLALRASGQGVRVCLLQFLKGDRECGEHKFVEHYRPFEILQVSSDSYFGQSNQERCDHAQGAASLARQILGSGDYGMVILDEVLTACQAGLLTVPAILDLLSVKRPETELVLTGRGAPADVVERADLVTEMRAVKHPFSRGVSARKGVEF